MDHNGPVGKAIAGEDGQGVFPFPQLLKTGIIPPENGLDFKTERTALKVGDHNFITQVQPAAEIQLAQTAAAQDQRALVDTAPIAAGIAHLIPQFPVITDRQCNVHAGNLLFYKLKIIETN